MQKTKNLTSMLVGGCIIGASWPLRPILKAFSILKYNEQKQDNITK